MKALTSTQYFFTRQTAFYRGKVRDVYTIADDILVIVATDRISAFDHVLPKSIPFKGQVLTEIASMFLDLTADIVPNWKLATPDPHVTVGKRCDAIPIEFVVRQYLTGHAWRVYRNGGRLLCGNVLPEGLKENDKLPEPIVTPATKAVSGHDEDISAEEILSKKLLSPKRWEALKDISLRLFQRGIEYAASKGLILVDTKYEFGLHNDEIYLIDEVHTPDSSRFFYADTYRELQEAGKPQRQLSKEFVREWLMENGFQGLEGQVMPNMPDSFVDSITQRYVELYTVMTGKAFKPRSYEHVVQEIENNINNTLINFV
ncbi:MAG: phosphoribosylaminoimidazolesuccinocarboxamide synthase [Sphingomonadales bacterium]|nr:phosphoribosylaminoimidazolesuccinocarboxamide synthase [Sphingomonadales bacterium]